MEWTLLSGEQVETVVAMLLCREMPPALRLRPAQGDGGIDLLVPGAGGAMAAREVFQVKKFAHSLTNSQKRKIKRSFDRVLQTSAQEGWTLTGWTLVCPLLPTPGNLVWFSELTAGAECKCHWLGLDHLNLLASRYPDVIDWYLHDGRDRLAAALEPLAAVIAGRTRRRTGQPLTATDLYTDLVSIHHAINTHDPHYCYTFEVSHIPPTGEEPPAPGLVALNAVEIDSTWIVTKVFALAHASLDERPIPIELRLSLPEDQPELHDQVRRFIDYGAPLELPVGTVSATLDLPGGLGGTFENGSARITPMTLSSVGHGLADESELRLGVLDTEGGVVAETVITCHERTAGAAGFRTLWRDTSDTLTVEMTGTADRLHGIEVTENLEVRGRRPGDVAAALSVSAALHHPHRVALSPSFGPRVTTPIAEIVGSADRELVAMARTAQALDIVQQHVRRRLLMPAGLTNDQGRLLDQAARLLTGQPIRATWPTTTASITVRDGDTRVEPGKTYQFCLIRDLEIELGDETITACQYAAILDGLVEFAEDHIVGIRLIHNSTVMFRFTGEGVTDGTVLHRARTITGPDSPR